MQAEQQGAAAPSEREQFERHVKNFTGRDIAYHERNGTTGLDFAWYCWQAARAQPSPTPPAADSVLEDAAFEAVRKKLCALPRYSFVLDDDGVVRRVQDRTGNWIEFDAAHELFDPVAVDAARSQAKEGA